MPVVSSRQNSQLRFLTCCRSQNSAKARFARSKQTMAFCCHFGRLLHYRHCKHAQVIPWVRSRGRARVKSATYRELGRSTYGRVRVKRTPTAAPIVHRSCHIFRRQLFCELALTWSLGRVKTFSDFDLLNRFRPAEGRHIAQMQDCATSHRVWHVCAVGAAQLAATRLRACASHPAGGRCRKCSGETCHL